MSAEESGTADTTQVDLSDDVSELIDQGRLMAALATPGQVRKLILAGTGPIQRGLGIGFGTASLILWALEHVPELLDELTTGEWVATK